MRESGGSASRQACRGDASEVKEPPSGHACPALGNLVSGGRTPFSRSASIDLHRYFRAGALRFVTMNVDDLSRVIDFDRDLRADSDIPEHATFGFEVKTLLPF